MALLISRLMRRKFSLQLRCLVDITGSNVRASEPSIQVIDDTIMRIISLNDKKYDYDSVLKFSASDKSCGMLHVLTIYDCLRTVRNVNKYPELITHSFRVISQLHQTGLLSQREIFLSCALFQWLEGNYFKAALLLETNNSTNPHDTLSMKMAQDCHLACGYNIGSLMCITRYLPLIHQSHPIRRNLLGLLSHGFVEGNYGTEAEETATRAIEMTSEHDLSCISAHLNLFIYQCKAAETSAAVDVSI